MNWIRPFALFVIFAFAGTAFSEEISTKESRWKQLSQAYGFLITLESKLHLVVRRAKAPFLSGCESRPATVAPAGSSRSG